ncbi:MAG TPA: D-alanine--D-alanine ligase family protein [Anaerolineales bacterium]|nr:D-alanine--D-alanine ligase family protein [Anaerolineales bacterium]
MAEERLRVGLIFGGRSGEHEISLLSARSVLAALDLEKYDVTQIGITHQGTWLIGDNLLEHMQQENYSSLNRVALLPDPSYPGLWVINQTQQADILKKLANLDVVFPILHGTYGEDGTIQGLFEMADLAYVGAGVLGSSVGMDKGVFKDVMRANDIPVLESIVVLRSEIEQDIETVLSKAEGLSPYPMFVKPANLGSSVGVTKCRRRSDLLEGLMEAARYDRRVLVERGINAREIEISVLGNDEPLASIPGEIIPAAEFYSYEAKYHDDRSQLLIPAPLPSQLVEQVQSLAVRAYKAVDCAGMARVDFLLEKNSNIVYLNELNTIPGFTRISMYPKLWEASGISYPALVDRLIELALERKQDRSCTERRYQRT